MGFEGSAHVRATPSTYFVHTVLPSVLSQSLHPLYNTLHLTSQEANFPRDFGVDTLAGILGIDPPSFGGRGRGRGAGRWGGGGGGAAAEEERKLVMAFLEKWKAFDWTSELDGELKCFVDWRAHSSTA